MAKKKSNKKVVVAINKVDNKSGEENKYEFYSLGFDEYIDSDGICVIEWSNFIKQLLPSELLNIEINILENDYRQLIFSAYGEKYERIVKQLCTL